MANDIYRIDLLASGGNFVTVTDDGTGVDWLEIRGSYASATDIRLNYSFSSTATDAAGLYYGGGSTNTLRVIGAIENFRGCDTADYVSGNELNNVLFGDQGRTGIGGNDTLNGNDGKDTLYGGSGADVLYGGNGNDKIFGDAGNDSIAGDAGADTIEGGVGADTLSGGATAGDTVAYTRSDAGVQINISFGLTTAGHGGDAEGDQISSFLNIIGSALDDVLIDTRKDTIAFGYNNNQFDGGAGNDRLEMGGGNDTALGGTGDDTLLGEDGRDRLLGDLGADSLSGGFGNDLLFGGAGNDTLGGGAGADRLTGGTGQDVLSGGGAADTFIFATLDDSRAGTTTRDTITDFKHAEGDKIDLHLIDAKTATAGVDDSFSFIGAGNFTNAAGQLHYRAVTGGILVEGDTDGNGTADFALFLQGIAAVVGTDFAL